MRQTTCPPPADLERLFLGGLPETEVELLEQHVLRCRACLERLKQLAQGKDTLANVLQGDTPGDGVALSPVVSALLTSLKTMRTAPPPAEAGRPGATQAFDAPHLGPDSSLTDFLAPRQADDELGRLGKYRILKVLGHGGMGVVFLAEDLRLKRTVALKAMLPALAASASSGKRFVREAEAMAKVEHDHIVRIYQIDEDRGVPFLAMEYLRGESLDDRLRREAVLPPAEVVRIGREIAEGLAAAHATGLIHRDIKPGNVWLEAPRDRVKILDFGLARAASQEAGVTQQGAIVGTPAYMAPEQGRGDAVDERCDLFSLGVVLYRMGAGRVPFPGRDAVSTLLAVATHEPAAPRTLNAHLPADLSNLVMRLLQKDPDRRPASAAEVVQVLQAIEKRLAHQQEVEATTPTVAEPAVMLPSPPLAPRRRRRVPLLIAAAALLLGLVGVGLWASGLIRFGTDQGDFVIDTDDADFKLSRGKDGGFVLEDQKTKRKYNVKAVRQGKGEYELEVTDADADLTFKTKTFTIKRGQTVALKAWFERKEVVAGKLRPIEDAWIKEVAAMPPEKQVEAVAAKLKERNPGFDGKVGYNLTLDRLWVGALWFDSENVTDISPLRALPELEQLNCRSHFGKGKLADLSPLKGMKLKYLDCSDTQVTDLSPLKGMELILLDCINTKVADLSPLNGMKLTSLNCMQTLVSDLTPLQGMKLRQLTVNASRVTDLSGLKGTEVEVLYCAQTRVSDLSPLKDMNLKGLNCAETRVSDLSPLKDMKLTYLNCGATKVADLSPLLRVPLVDLVCDFKAERDAEILRAMQTLKNINGKPAAEFWKDVAAQLASFDAWLKQVAALPAEKQVEAVAAKLKELNPGFDGRLAPTIDNGAVTGLKFSTDRVTNISPVRALTRLATLDCSGSGIPPQGVLADLSPLRGLPLKELQCGHNRGVTDLSPLAEMPLEKLGFGYTGVRDLGPLRGLKLREFDTWDTPIEDIAPLRGMPLEVLVLGYAPVKDLAPVAGMPLRRLWIQGVKAPSLDAVRGLKIEHLCMENAAVASLEPLREMPLKVITLSFKPERDAKVLRSLTSLQSINDKPAAEFWKEVEAQHAAFDDWAKQVAAMPAEKQVEAVAAKLKERNPGFDGQVRPMINAGVVTWLQFNTDNVTDISPVRALTELTSLTCNGSGRGGPGKLRDLSPLQGMKLMQLNCHETQVCDLAPLKGLPLMSLNCMNTEVADLSPLGGMMLKDLNCHRTKITDLSPLRGMPLVYLFCDFQPGRDTDLLRSLKTLERINGKPAAEFWKDVDMKKP